MTTTPPPPGYYPSPDGEPHQRYWDGRAWTDQTRPVGPPASPMAMPPAKKKSWFARHKVLTGVLGLLVLVVFISAVSGGGGSSGSKTNNADNTPNTPAASKATTPKAAASKATTPKSAPGMGTPVRDGKFQFTVTRVQPGVASVGTAPVSQQAQGQFVKVYVTVQNIGDQSQLFDASSQKAFDTQGKKYDADGGAAIYLGDTNSFLQAINPGNAVKGILLFDVPKSVKLTQIELHDSLFSGGVKVRLS